ncbi:MAG: hypothetical protein AAB458_02165, partial [Patescibacteria group bacterium]
MVIFAWVFSGLPYIQFGEFGGSTSKILEVKPPSDLPPGTTLGPLPGQLSQTRVARLVQIPQAHADTAGPNNPAAAASIASSTCSNSVNWGTLTGTPFPTAINDTTYTKITGGNWDAAEVTDELEMSQYGFSFRGTPTGVLVEVLGWSPAGGAHTYTDVRLRTAQGIYVGVDKATGALGTSDPGSSYTSFGSSQDLWTATSTLTESVITSTGFGVALCFTAAGANSNINIDHVRITVTYTPTATLNQSAYKWFGNNSITHTNVGSGAPNNQAAVAPPQGTPLRLRMLLHNSGVDLGVSGTTTKLQFAERSGECDTAFSGESYADLSYTTALAFASTSKGVNAEMLTPFAVFFKPDGLKMYVVEDFSGSGINEYNLSTAWNVSTASFLQVKDISAEGDSPHGLFFKPDGLKMYVTEAVDDEVNEYNLST